MLPHSVIWNWLAYSAISGFVLLALATLAVVIHKQPVRRIRLIQLGLVDEIHVYVAPLIFGGADSPTLADGLGLTREMAIQLQTDSVMPLEDGGIIITYKTK